MTAKTPVSTYQKISLVQKSSVPLSGVANKHLPALETMPTLTEQVYKNSVDWEKVSEKLGKIPDEPSDELIGKGIHTMIELSNISLRKRHHTLASSLLSELEGIGDGQFAVHDEKNDIYWKVSHDPIGVNGCIMNTWIDWLMK